MLLKKFSAEYKEMFSLALKNRGENPQFQTFFFIYEFQMFEKRDFIAVMCRTMNIIFLEILLFFNCVRNIDGKKIKAHECAIDHFLSEYLM